MKSPLAIAIHGSNVTFYLFFLFLLCVITWDALRNLVPFAQFKKPENRPWRIVTFNKVTGWSNFEKAIITIITVWFQTHFKELFFCSMIMVWYGSMIMVSGWYVHRLHLLLKVDYIAIALEKRNYGNYFVFCNC